MRNNPPAVTDLVGLFAAGTLCDSSIWRDGPVGNGYRGVTP